MIKDFGMEAVLSFDVLSQVAVPLQQKFWDVPVPPVGFAGEKPTASILTVTVLRPFPKGNTARAPHLARVCLNCGLLDELRSVGFRLSAFSESRTSFLGLYKPVYDCVA